MTLSHTLDMRRALTEGVISNLLDGDHDGSPFTVVILRVDDKESNEPEFENVTLVGDLTISDGKTYGCVNVSEEVGKMLKPYGGKLEPWNVIDVLEYSAEMYPGTKLFKGCQLVTLTKIRKTVFDEDFRHSMKLTLKTDFMGALSQKPYFNEDSLQRFPDENSCICPLDETCLVRAVFGHLRFNSGLCLHIISEAIDLNHIRDNFFFYDMSRSHDPIDIEWTEEKRALIAKLLVDARAKHDSNPLELRHHWEPQSLNANLTLLRILSLRECNENVLGQLYPVIEKELDDSAKANIRRHAYYKMAHYKKFRTVDFLKALRVPLVSSPKDAVNFFDDIQFDDCRFIEIVEADGFDLNSNHGPFRLLHSMAEMHFRECVEFLLNRGFDVESRNENGLTPFMTVVLSDYVNRLKRSEYSFKRLEFLRWLISKGADPLAVTPDQKTCLHVAIAERRENSISYLMTLGLVVVRRAKGKKPELVEIEEKMKKKTLNSLLKDERVFYWPNQCERCEQRCQIDCSLCIWCDKREKSRERKKVLPFKKRDVAEEAPRASVESEAQNLSTNSLDTPCVDYPLRSPPAPILCKFEFCCENDHVISKKDKNYFEAFCKDKCRVIFHRSCWNKFKGEVSTKNFLGANCMTPDCPSQIHVIHVLDLERNLKAQYSMEEREQKVKKQKRQKVDSIFEAKENQNQESKLKFKNQTESIDQNIREVEDRTSMPIENEMASLRISPAPKLTPDLIHLEEEYLIKLEKPHVDEENFMIKSSKKRKKKKKNARENLFQFNLFAESVSDGAGNGNEANENLDSLTLDAGGEISQSAPDPLIKEISYQTLFEQLANNGNRCTLATLQDKIQDWDPPLRQSLLTEGLKEALLSDSLGRFSLCIEDGVEMVCLKVKNETEIVEDEAILHDQLRGNVPCGERTEIEAKTQDDACQRCATLENRCNTMESRCVELENRCSSLESRYSALEERFVDLQTRLENWQEEDGRDNFRELCCFCQETLLKKRITSLRLCRHRYHSECLKDYKGQACPLCRAPMQED